MTLLFSHRRNGWMNFLEFWFLHLLQRDGANFLSIPRSYVFLREILVYDLLRNICWSKIYKYHSYKCDTICITWWHYVTMTQFCPRLHQAAQLERIFRNSRDAILRERLIKAIAEIALSWRSHRDTFIDSSPNVEEQEKRMLMQYCIIFYM